MESERRFTTHAELRVKTNAAGKPVLEGYAAVFGTLSENLGGFRETIAPGAFTRCIANADVRALINHDPNRILGRTRAGTLKVSQDSKGLPFECTMPDVDYARNLLVSVDRGDITGCSFRFYTAEGGDTWQDDPRGFVLRTLTDVEIDDVSPCTYPAYPDAFVSVRSLDHLKAHQAAKRRKPRLELLGRRLRLAEA